MTPADRLPLWKKLLFSAVSVAGFFLLFELLLLAIGFSVDDAGSDPFVGFSGYAPLMEASLDKEGKPILKTAANKLNWFNEIEFTPDKPANTYRIFCLGGSTTYGHPYWDITSYSRWMREALPIIDNSKQWEVINAGGISYASYRVANVMQELAQYQPDAFIVFSAHNEFLERRTYGSMIDSPVIELSGLLSRTRTWQLVKRILKSTSVSPHAPSSRSGGGDEEALSASDSSLATKPTVLPIEVDEMLNHTIGPVDYHRDPLWRAGVVRHYEVNLTRMTRIAAQAGAKLLFVVPASNNKDCSPFKTEPDPSLDEDALVELQSLQTQGYEAIGRDDWKQAESSFEAVLRIDPDYADAHYRLGKVLFRQDRFEEADGHFRRALDCDVCPLRAIGEINAVIRKVAATHRLPIIDFEDRLRTLSRLEEGHACLGDKYFLDHVHPTIDVHRRLALWIIESMQAEGIVRGGPLSDSSHAEPLHAVRAKVESETTPHIQGIGLRNLAKTLHWAGRYEESAPLAENAIGLLGDDPESLFVLADSRKNLGRPAEAIQAYQRLMEVFPDYFRAYHPYGELLAREGWYQQAKGYLVLAFTGKPNNANIAYWLGLCHLELKEYDLAVESFTLADKLYPDDPSTLFCLAQAKNGIGETQAAKAILNRLIQQGFDSPAVREELATLDSN